MGNHVSPSRFETETNPHVHPVARVIRTIAHVESYEKYFSRKTNRGQTCIFMHAHISFMPIHCNYARYLKIHSKIGKYLAKHNRFGRSFFLHPCCFFFFFHKNFDGKIIKMFNSICFSISKTFIQIVCILKCCAFFFPLIRNEVGFHSNDKTNHSLKITWNSLFGGR